MRVRTITFAALVAGLGFYGCNQIPETSSVTGAEISDLSLDSDIAAVSEDLSETTAILGLEGSLGGGQSEIGRRSKRRPSPLRGLDLSDEQKTALKELMRVIHDQAKAAIEAARADGADREAIGAIREGLKAELDAGLAAILTAEQLVAFQGAKAEVSQRRQKHTSPFAGLELTEDQQAAIRALRETSNEQMKAAIEAAKADGADMEAVKATLEGLRADFETDLAAILTPDQLAAWQAARAQKEPRTRGNRGRRKGGHNTPAAPAEETAGNSEVN